MLQLSKNNFYREEPPTFLGIYFAKYSEKIFSFPFQQVEENNFQVCSQELIFPFFFGESFSVSSWYGKGGLALG